MIEEKIHPFTVLKGFQKKKGSLVQREPTAELTERLSAPIMAGLQSLRLAARATSPFTQGSHLFSSAFGTRLLFTAHSEELPKGSSLSRRG